MPNYFNAWFYDGKTAVKRTVSIDIIGNAIFLDEQERRHGPYALDLLNYNGEVGRTNVYGYDRIEGWRLGISGDIPTELNAHLPAKKTYGRMIDRLGIGRATIAFTIVSAAVVALIMFTPQWLAPLIPASAEKRLGDAIIGDFGGRFCHTKNGDAALKKLAGALDKDISDLQIEVANIDMLNAVALPGGKVIIFNDLLTKARSADEVAGVLAHEMGHVRKRHVMQSLIRQMGLSVVLGGFDGNVGGAVNGALSTTYTRGSENEADQYSIDALSKANISPIATADFFQRLAKIDGSADTDKRISAVAGYMSSHPLSTERKEAFLKSLEKGRKYSPALTPKEWQELKTMCAQDRNVKSGFGFDFGDESDDTGE
jgi:beta-barrel assembly-enhancing protease